jgi:glycosyltransferase involved in cell wall biosynthesis
MLTTVVAVSDLVRQQYLRVNPSFDSHCVVTVPNGVDRSRLHRVPRELARQQLGLTGEHLFISLSRHSLQKNTYGLASAFDEVAERLPDVHLLIAGRPEPGDYPAQVRELQRSMPNGARLHLKDAVTSPSALLAAADSFVLDSFFEGWSLASMEAMAIGVPVVISDVGGAREQLSGRPERGILVDNPAGDPLAVNWSTMSAYRFRRQPNRDQLVHAMVSMAERGLSTATCRREIAREALEDFNADRCLSAHAAVLAEAAARRR